MTGRTASEGGLQKSDSYVFSSLAVSSKLCQPFPALLVSQFPHCEMEMVHQYQPHKITMRF